MPLLTKTEIKQAEIKYSEGIASADVVRIFVSRGLKFSEATLRKYVQLGLLPTSKRVGMGKHRGSSGVYPAATVGMINRIKKALDAGHSLDDLISGAVGLHSAVEGLRRSAVQTYDKLAAVVQSQPSRERATLGRLLRQQRLAFTRHMKDLAGLVQRLEQSEASRS